MKRYYITLTLLVLITITGGQHAFAQDAPAVELQVETEQPLTEYNLEDAVVTLTLTGKTYEAQVVAAAVRVSGIAGVSLSDVTRESDTVLKVTLAYPLIDFDADTELRFSVSAVVIANYNKASLTAKIPVIGVKESLSALPVAPLTEANLDDGVVRLILEGGTWRSLSSIRSKVTVSGIDGVTIQKQSYRYCASGWVCFGIGNRTGYRPAVRRVNNTVLEVPLAFDETDFDTDATLTFTVEADALQTYKGAELTAEIPVTAVREKPAPDLVIDVNDDGIVDVQDLVYVAERYGQTGTKSADVNDDSVVDIDDLILVAAVLDADAAAAAAPSLYPDSFETLTVADVKLWLSQARQRDVTDPSVRRGILFLEHLLASMVPKETALLANYPNPFNPETWIPYQLAKSADVTLTIYAVDGTVVRMLSLGHQAAGAYQNRSRAAYWDGRNAVGEPVASGVYFYTLTAGDFTATRKLLIRK